MVFLDRTTANDRQQILDCDDIFERKLIDESIWEALAKFAEAFEVLGDPENVSFRRFSIFTENLEGWVGQKFVDKFVIAEDFQWTVRVDGRNDCALVSETLFDSSLKKVRSFRFFLLKRFIGKIQISPRKQSQLSIL